MRVSVLFALPLLRCSVASRADKLVPQYKDFHPTTWAPSAAEQAQLSGEPIVDKRNSGLQPKVVVVKKKQAVCEIEKPSSTSTTVERVRQGRY